MAYSRFIAVSDFCFEKAQFDFALMQYLLYLLLVLFRFADISKYEYKHYNDNALRVLSFL